MEKTSDGSFARITRKTAEDDDDEKDWGMALNRYLGPAPSGLCSLDISAFNAVAVPVCPGGTSRK